MQAEPEPAIELASASGGDAVCLDNLQRVICRSGMAKTRVYEIAKEFGVDSAVVLAQLTEMGALTRSASSTLEPVIVHELRRRFKDTPPGAGQASPCSHSAPRVNRPRPLPRARREWHRGEPPTGFTAALLDGHVMPMRHPEARPPGRRYWPDEVAQARDLAARWKGCLLEFMPDEVLLGWVGSGVDPEDAIALHRRGVRPSEVGWSYDDRGLPTLAARLAAGVFTVEEVAIEVEGRRVAG